jgi:hypothetical protein
MGMRDNNRLRQQLDQVGRPICDLHDGKVFACSGNTLRIGWPKLHRHRS